MPETPLGRLLIELVPDPPTGLDVGAVLSRSHRRRVRAALAVAAFVVVGTSLGALVGTQAGGQRSTPGQAVTSDPTPEASPTGPTPPQVQGLSLPAALAALDRSHCYGVAERIVRADVPLGAVASQGQPDKNCQVPLTVSGGLVAPAPLCAELTVTAGELGAAAGTVGFPLAFTNAGATPCEIGGYPQVTATDSVTGRRVAALATRSAMLSGVAVLAPATLRLAPGDVVSVLVEGGDNPAGDATSCSELSAFKVTLGGSTTGLSLRFPGCGGMQVSALVPGATGRLT